MLVKGTGSRWTITMQGFILTAITAAEKCTLILYPTLNIDKSNGPRNVGQGHRFKVRACRASQ